jgi:hypothetical protein
MMIAPVARLFSAMSFYFAYRLAVQATPRHNSDRKKENIMKVIKSAAELAKLEAGQKDGHCKISAKCSSTTSKDRRLTGHYRPACHSVIHAVKFASTSSINRHTHNCLR